MIRCIEEHSMNAWPCMQALLCDGWVLRFASGYTRRSNSVYPLYPSTLPLEEKIDEVEAVYRSKGLPAVFKITSASQPENLDAALEARGYRAEAPTSVQVLDLRACPTSDADPRVMITPTPTEEWKQEFARMSRVEEQRAQMHEAILARIVPRAGYASIRHDGWLAACGLGVVQHGYLGIFDIVTDAECRRRGHGKEMMKALLDWGKSHGASTAYLQVMKDNGPALNLYAGLGFKEAYPYWYRVQG